MHFIVLKHAANEGPGTLTGFLESHGVDLMTAELHAGAKVPERIGSAAALISMGGPMNVYEEERYPFLRDEDLLLRSALDLGVPVLGICLGAQLLAKACGAKVTRAPEEEVGFSQVRVTPEGLSDPLLSGLGAEFDVLQWHRDTFEVPEGGVLLAEGGSCRNQAFRCGPCAYGLQFHLEATPTMIAEWFDGQPSEQSILRHLKALGSAVARTAEMLYLNLLGIVARTAERRSAVAS